MKNDTINAEIGTRAVVNRPFWIASGVVSGSNVTLFVSPGRMRFPYATKVVYSGQPSSLTFGGLASRYYTVFLRSDQTFYVSGSTTATVPGPKYQDSEYLGQVWTGASLSTANLRGPWNQGSAYNPYEQRGEAAAITAAVPVMYAARDSNIANFTAGATASGIGWLTYADRSTMAPLSLLGAMVRWVPSGALASPGYMLPSGMLHMTPQFFISKAIGTVMATYQATHTFLQPQNPDNPNVASITASIPIPGAGATPSADGYVLKLQTQEPTTTGAQMRIQEVRFYGIPGNRPSGGPDTGGEPS